MSGRPLAAVVEDDFFLAEIYSESLQSIGLDVKVFNDGGDAMKELVDLNPNLIILDLNLPTHSGLEIFYHLRQQAQTAETWVLIVTANPSQAAELSNLEMDNQNLLILAKPLSMDQLDQLAQRLVFRN